MNEENIPLSIQTFLDKNNYELVKFKVMKSIYKVKCAYLKSIENHKKNFLFEYDENKNYYFFIVKKENPKYLNQIDLESQTRSFFANQKDKKANKGIIFDFDYNKYILYGILGRICEKSKDFKHEKDKDILLNREICAVSHATYDGINYYKLTKSKSIKLEKSQKIFDNFNLMLEKYYIIEIENKKPVSETTIKEDGIISVLYLLTPERNEVSKIFTMIKYTLYFIKETLINYI